MDDQTNNTQNNNQQGQGDQLDSNPVNNPQLPVDQQSPIDPSQATGLLSKKIIQDTQSNKTSFNIGPELGSATVEVRETPKPIESLPIKTEESGENPPQEDKKTGQQLVTSPPKVEKKTKGRLFPDIYGYSIPSNIHKLASISPKDSSHWLGFLVERLEKIATNKK